MNFLSSQRGKRRWLGQPPTQAWALSLLTSLPSVKINRGRLPAFTLIELLLVIASFTFVDGEETLLSSGAFVQQEGQESCWWTVPASRDRGYGANLAFADGHVEFHKWKYPHRIRRLPETPIANALDLQDLRWLISRVPGAR